MMKMYSSAYGRERGDLRNAELEVGLAQHIMTVGLG